jgi:hypothetical protein
MRATLITVLNFLSLIPIFIYPAIVMSGIMAGASPNAGKFLGWVVLIISFIYPLILIALVLLSRKHNSLLIAIIAVIPFLFLLYIFFIQGISDQKKNFDSLEKSFTCGTNQFLSIVNSGSDSINRLYFLEKKNILSYRVEYIANILDNNSLYVLGGRTEGIDMDSLLNNCKNTENKSPLDLYRILSNEEYNNIIKN